MDHLYSASSMRQSVRPNYSPGEDAHGQGGRLLVPVKHFGDVEAVLAHLVALGRGADVHLAIVHVTPPTETVATRLCPGDAETLLEHVESRCRAASVAFESHILAGDIAFSILDAAELLACDAILLPVLKPRPWHLFFLTGTARKLQRLQRDVPLVLIDADGAVIGRTGE